MILKILRSEQSRSKLSKGRRQLGWMGVAVTPKCKEGARWTHKKGSSLGAPVRNALITTPSLAIILSTPFIVPLKQQRGLGACP